MKIFLDVKVEYRDQERDQLCLHPDRIQTHEQGRIADRTFLGAAYLLYKNYGISLRALEENAGGAGKTVRAIREGNTTWEEALGLEEKSDE
jgi:hypothetical protein